VKSSVVGESGPPVRRSSSYVTVAHTSNPLGTWTLFNHSRVPAGAHRRLFGGASNLDTFPATVSSFYYSEACGIHTTRYTAQTSLATQTFIPAPRMILPDDIGISERSRKFYNGTYTLTSNGFIDEHGGTYTLATCKEQMGS
jgi:hypothetical protein